MDFTFRFAIQAGPVYGARATKCSNTVYGARDRDVPQTKRKTVRIGKSLAISRVPIGIGGHPGRHIKTRLNRRLDEAGTSHEKV